MTSFVRPDSLDEAARALASPGAAALAGGTDLMIHLRHQRLNGGELPESIVDLGGLDELNRLELDADPPFLGAGITFRTLETDPVVRESWPLLAQSAATVGSVQVRHTATIGGNAANASPAADGVSALAALGAVALVAGPNGERRVKIGELITAPGKNSLQPGELIVGFNLDSNLDPAGQHFLKVGRRQAVAIARLNVAVCLDRELADPRFVLGACFPSPRRLDQVEDLLRNGQPSEELWNLAGKAAAQSFVETCGWRSSAEYKVPAIERVATRALSKAWAGLAGAA